MAEGAGALDRLLTDYPGVQAVIGVSDLVAFGLLSECQRRGIDVPGRLTIAGFGNYEIGRICVPRLTTLDVHAGRIGTMAASLIARILRDDAGDQPARIEIPADLIVRESSG